MPELPTAVDPTIAQTLVYIGLVISGIIAGLVGFRGWRKGGHVPPDKDMLISGAASITDMTPVKELVKQADLLCLKLMAATTSVDAMVTQQNRTAVALEKISDQIGSYLAQRKHDAEVEAEVERRLLIKTERAARARASRTRNKPTE